MSNFLPHYLRAVSFVVIGAAVYVFLARRLADLVQPLRLRLAREGEALLASSLDPDDARQVRFWLDNAFSAVPAAIFVMMFPMLMTNTLIGRLLGKHPKPLRSGAAMRRLSLLFMASAFAANPLFGVIALLELILFGVTVGVLTDPLLLFRSVLSVLGLEARLWGRRHRHVS